MSILNHIKTEILYTKTSLPYTSLPLHFATVTKIFRLFPPKNRGFVTIFPKISNFRKILRSNFIATGCSFAIDIFQLWKKIGNFCQIFPKYGSFEALGLGICDFGPKVWKFYCWFKEKLQFQGAQFFSKSGLTRFSEQWEN